ncbi:sugar phosphate nucleotidyltransferase [Azohydromonas lata]|uniref:Sugar phosphate nucleotidyltransferase n=1 Tax=Azohydromonas lata TaxID=45677 RepID=A0ABU5ICD6_9BURK|nr:sugar phosphate nucleotidyltransferase [Azohydromonas lata]MDZ5456777.1 sugar phosphate nucleotidyltransferase [Azohydromonas lata]
MAARRIAAFVLAGGEGTRLRPFTLALPKPALPLAGCWRIIDLVLSNLYNSEIRQIFVLPQYKPDVLVSHLQRRWNVASRHALTPRLAPSMEPSQMYMFR